VAVVWDGEGTTIAGTTYRNTYAWFMTLEDGKVINGTAFYDSIAFHELGDRQTRQIAGTGGAGARIVVGLVQGRRPADEVQSSPGVVPNAEHGFAMPGRSGWPAGVRGGGPRRVAQLGDAGTAHG
jgi:hypothetical protein